MKTPKNEHEVHIRTDFEVFYPDHPPRSESAVFRETKKKWHSMGAICSVCGASKKVEIHHKFIEWADYEGVDWDLVKKIHLDFNWESFSNPEDFIDSFYNTEPLCELHHRGPAPFGKHFTPEPIWNMQKYKKKDFVYTDEKP